VCKSALNASENSDNEHHFITERSAWKLLRQLIKINPVKANNSFRLACGFTPVINEDDEYSDLKRDRNKFIGRNLSISYQKNLKIIRGALQYLYDDKGKTYIDCVNNVSHVGHCHPSVVKAMQKQLASLNTNTRYLHDSIVEYSKMLTSTLPEELSVCYFTNSGSEANDLAIRISRHFTNQKDVIVLDHAYHGTSTTAIELSPYKFDGKGGFGKKPYIHKAKNPDLYRGEFRYNDADTGKKYAADTQRIIEELKKENKLPAAFICETLLGVGGQIPLPPGYLKEVYHYIRSSGGICIADEVQVGFGRVGECFWGFQLQQVVPDIVVLGKPIGNGHPLAAVITTPAIADAFNNGMEYFNTFGGNPVSMACGLAVLNTIKDEELQLHAMATGNHLLNSLKSLMNKHPIIGDVRGHGLFIGAELVRDRITLEPAVPEINRVVEEMKERGFLISTDGPLYNVLKIKPPLVFNIENADDLVKNLDEVLSLL
ncbi:MAG: aminotransferase class III-fold pyridoxal phosphate-dependent enzyme, partial [Chitinophagaceae bacterium]